MEGVNVDKSEDINWSKVFLSIFKTNLSFLQSLNTSALTDYEETFPLHFKARETKDLFLAI